MDQLENLFSSLYFRWCNGATNGHRYFCRSNTRSPSRYEYRNIIMESPKRWYPDAVSLSMEERYTLLTLFYRLH